MATSGTFTGSNADESAVFAFVLEPGTPTDPPPDPPDTDTAAGRYGWGQPIPEWSDDFNYTGTPDPAKWSLPGNDWEGHNGNGRRRPERQTVTDGKLVMTGLANGDTGWMRHNLERQYGRYEIQCRSSANATSNGNDYHVLLLIWPTSENRPQDGEYDWLEVDTPGADTAEAYIHYPHPGTSTVQQEHAEKPGVDLSEWHNVAFEWTPDYVRGFIDGEEWFEFSGGANSVRRDIQTMPSGHLVVQLDNFDGTDQTPATFELNWVRFYSLVPTGPPPGAQSITASGIGSAQAFGIPAVQGGQTGPPPGSVPTLIGINTVLGTATLGYTGGDDPPPAGGKTVSGAGGIATGQTFGQPVLTVDAGEQTIITIAPLPDEAHGQPTVTVDGAPPPAPGGVLVPALFAVGADGTTLTPLTEWSKITLSPVRNSPGSLTIEYPAGAPGFSVLDDRISAYPLRALEVRIWLGGNASGAIGGWLVQKEGDDLTPGSMWTFSGHFHEWILSKAIIAPQPKSEANPKGELRFQAASAGLVLKTVMDQAQARGALPLVTRDWDETRDSNGQPWVERVSSLNLAPKTTIQQVADKLVELGMCEFELTAARVWRAYAPGTRGVDRTVGPSPLTFAHAVDLQEHARRESARDAGTAVLAAGSEGFYSWAESATAAAELGWRAEVGVDAGQISSQDGVQAVAATSLEAIRNGVAEHDGKIEFGPGSPLPFLDWGIGDWAVTWVGSKRRRLRIAQIGLEFVRGVPPQGTVVLNDVIADKVAMLYRRLNAITAGDAVVGTSTPSPGGTGEDTIPPAAPTGLTVSSTIAFQVPGETVTRAVVSAGWAAVLNDAYADGEIAGKAAAAPLIAERLRSGQLMAADWTWDNNPIVVGQYAAVLLEEFEQAHPEANLPDTAPQRNLIAEAWLRAWPAAHQGGGPVTGDVKHYRVQHQYLGPQPVTEVPDTTPGGSPPVDVVLPEDIAWVEPAESPTTSTSLTFGDIEGGRSLGVRVAAVDRADNQGPWSETVAVDTASDDQPPPVPSKPIVATTHRMLSVTWDGKGSSGEDMLAAAQDFASGGMIEVHVALGIDFIPDRPTGMDGKVDLSLSTTYKTNFLAAGTTSLGGLEIGSTYFVRFVAVDRNGNPSLPSATSDGIQPKQMVTIDYGPDTVDRATIRALAVGSAEIDVGAVNELHVDSVNAGAIRSGTMTADVVMGGRFRTPTINGNTVEFDNAGIRLYAGNTVVGRWQVSDASMLVTGTYLSGLNGERINILPDGTMHIFGAVGVDSAKIRNDGGIVRMESRADSAGRRSFVDFDPTGLNVKYGSPTQVRSMLNVGLTYGVLNAPVTGIRVWRQYTPTDNSEPRFHFVMANASGDINDSVLHYVLRSGNPAILAPGITPLGAGIMFSNDSVSCVNGAGTDVIRCEASAFVVGSSELRKRDITPIHLNHGLSSLDVVDRVPIFQWRYDSGPDEPRTVPLQKRQADGSMATEHVRIEGESSSHRMHYFPMAEHLQKYAPELVHEDRNGRLLVSVSDTLGLALAALQELSVKVRRLEGDTKPIVVEGQVLDPSRWLELPEGRESGDQ